MKTSILFCTGLTFAYGRSSKHGHRSTPATRSTYFKQAAVPHGEPNLDEGFYPSSEPMGPEPDFNSMSDTNPYPEPNFYTDTNSYSDTNFYTDTNSYGMQGMSIYPEPSYDVPGFYEPGSDYYQPEPDFYEPGSDYYNYKPEPDYYQPKPDYYQPKPDYYQPEPDYYQPEPDYYQPEPDYYQPEPDFYEPGFDYYYEPIMPPFDEGFPPMEIMPHITCYDGGFDKWCSSSWDQKRACVYAKNTVSSTVKELYSFIKEQNPSMSLNVDTILTKLQKDRSRVVAINSTNAKTVYDGIEFNSKNVSATAPALWEELQYGDGFVFGMEDSNNARQGYGAHQLLYTCSVHWVEHSEESTVVAEPPVAIVDEPQVEGARMKRGKLMKASQMDEPWQEPQVDEPWQEPWPTITLQLQHIIIAARVPML